MAYQSPEKFIAVVLSGTMFVSPIHAQSVGVDYLSKLKPIPQKSSHYDQTVSRRTTQNPENPLEILKTKSEPSAKNDDKRQEADFFKYAVIGGGLGQSCYCPRFDI